MSPLPDRLGFSDAMTRLRENLGIDVTFHVTMAPVWDPDEKLDPQTGKPMDPWATPIASGSTDVTLRASLVSRPLARLMQDESMNSPLGDVNADTFALILAAGASATVGTAKSCSMIDGRRYLVTDFRDDIAVGSHPRTIAYLKRG